jgi:Flp pilus assembly protein TadB
MSRKFTPFERSQIAIAALAAPVGVAALAASIVFQSKSREFVAPIAAVAFTTTLSLLVAVMWLRWRSPDRSAGPRRHERQTPRAPRTTIASLMILVAVCAVAFWVVFEPTGIALFTLIAAVAVTGTIGVPLFILLVYPRFTGPVKSLNILPARRMRWHPQWRDHRE